MVMLSLNHWLMCMLFDLLPDPNRLGDGIVRLEAAGLVQADSSSEMGADSPKNSQNFPLDMTCKSIRCIIYTPIFSYQIPEGSRLTCIVFFNARQTWNVVRLSSMSKSMRP